MVIDSFGHIPPVYGYSSNVSKQCIRTCTLSSFSTALCFAFPTLEQSAASFLHCPRHIPGLWTGARLPRLRPAACRCCLQQRRRSCTLPTSNLNFETLSCQKHSPLSSGFNPYCFVSPEVETGPVVNILEPKKPAERSGCRLGILPGSADSPRRLSSHSLRPRLRVVSTAAILVRPIAFSFIHHSSPAFASPARSVASTPRLVKRPIHGWMRLPRKGGTCVVLIHFPK